MLKALSDFAEEDDVTKDNLYGGFHPSSKEYLKDALTKPANAYGFPRLTYTTSFIVDPKIPLPPEKDSLQQLPKISNMLLTSSSVIQKLLGAKHNALCTFYPAGGYLSWHHNGNAPGYNILMSYSKNGDGTFDWMKKDGNVIEMKDQPGWNIKAGYYGSIHKDEDLFWHVAKAEEPRLTIAFAMDHEPMWSNAVKMIENTI